MNQTELFLLAFVLGFVTSRAFSWWDRWIERRSAARFCRVARTIEDGLRDGSIVLREPTDGGDG